MSTEDAGSGAMEAPPTAAAAPSRAEAVRAIARLAYADTRRGIDFWFDPELTEALRDLALGAPAPPPSTTPAKSDAPPASVPPPALVPPTPPGTAPSAPSAAKAPVWGAPPLATGRDPDWQERLGALGRRAGECRRCALCETRNKVVFGVGSAAVPLVFVGEAPGADEDREGYPFVGRAGQLLDKIIRAIGLERDEIYICNVLKCRPPGNRNPEPEEIAKCTPYLEEQLAILRPKVICSLGLFASQFLAGSALPIGKLRGRVLDYGGTPLIPTYHPAALLRNPGLKAATWDDVQLVRRTLDR